MKTVKKAQDAIQDEHSTYLNAEQVVLICDIFETNTCTVDTFLNYKKFKFRKAWVDKHLKQAGHTFDNTTDNSIRVLAIAISSVQCILSMCAVFLYMMYVCMIMLCFVSIVRLSTTYMTY